MSWTAFLDSAGVTNGTGTLVIIYSSDDKRTFTERETIGSPGDHFLEKRVAQRIRNLEAMDDYIAGLQPGPITPFADPSPSPDQQAADAFFALQAKLTAMQTAVANGILKPDDPGIVQLTSDLKAAFLPAYTTDFRWR